MEEDPDIFRIFIATDNHLGVYERDPVRCDDSYAAFEEILNLAKDSDSDMLLLGGDLYHEAAPSRICVQRTIELLAKYCLSDDPVSFEVISDAEANFRNPSKMPNYLHPHLAVGLPVFMVHGNHDAPSREGRFEPLGAIDHLAAANLVNYFGTSERVDDVEISPVLLRKGNTRVALYGLGWMRDERLNRMWHQKKVKFLRPTEEDGRDEFFNIFVIHQNRDTGRGRKNCVHESMIPNWIDLVIWGHEHDCCIMPVDSLGGSFKIIQPGSSVATSLTAGEAERKHVTRLDVKGDQWRVVPFALQQVRPLIFEEISLRAIPELNPTSARIEDEIAAYIDRALLRMIDEASEADASMAVEEGFKVQERREGYRFKILERSKPLLRIRVEHSGFPTIRISTFAGRYMDRVANPGDMILLNRRKGAAVAPEQPEERRSTEYRSIFEDNDEVSEAVNINRIVEQQLAQGRGLKVLTNPDMTLALQEFVEQRDARAIEETVDKLLFKMQNRLIKTRNTGSSPVSRDEISKAVDDINEKLSLKAEKRLERKRMNGGAVESKSSADTTFQQESEGFSMPQEASTGSRVSEGRYLSDDDDEEEESAYRDHRKKRLSEAVEEADEDDEESLEARAKKLKDQKKAPELKAMAEKLGLPKSGTKMDLATRILQAQASRPAGGARSKRSRPGVQDSDDEDDAEEPGTVSTVSSRGGSKRGSTRKRSKPTYAVDVDLDEDEDDIESDEGATGMGPEGEGDDGEDYDEIIDDDEDDDDGGVDDGGADDDAYVDQGDEDEVVVMPSRPSKRRARVLEDSQAAAGEASKKSSGRTLPSFFGKRRSASQSSQASANMASFSSLASAFK